MQGAGGGACAAAARTSRSRSRSLDPFAARGRRRAAPPRQPGRRRSAGFVRDGGEVFGALSERQGQLRGLIQQHRARSSRRRRSATRTSQAAVHGLPDLPARVADDADAARAVRARHRPGGHRAAPGGARAGADPDLELGDLAPELRALLRRPAARRSTPRPTGFPALRRLLDDDLPPLLTRLDPFLDELTPILTVIRQYRHEVTALPRQRRRGDQRDQRRGRRAAPLHPHDGAVQPRDDRRRIPRRLRLEPHQPLHRAEGLPEPADRARVVRDRAVHERDQRDPRPRPPPRTPTSTRTPTATSPRPRICSTGCRSSSFVDTTQSNDVPQARLRQAGGRSASIGGAFEEFSDYLHVRALD